MTERGSVAFGDTNIDYTVLRSVRRKKTIQITLDHQEGILVAAPSGTPAKQIADVVRKRAGWIVRNRNRSVLNPVRKELASGESLPYLGKRVTLFVQAGEVNRVAVSFSHWRLRVKVPYGLAGDERRSEIANALGRWYKCRAVERLGDRVRYWTHIVGCEPGQVLIRDQRQRWGSCSADGTLRFNWRLIQVEPALIDYVVVHELVHLHLMNHSSQFWDEVARVLPDYRLRRQRLKESGADLVL